MSVDFFVICRSAAPPDLEEVADSRALPFGLRVETIETWRTETRQWIADLEERSAFTDELERRLEQPWGFVVSMNCRSGAAEFTQQCAHELIARAGGFYYDDHSDELSAIAQGTGLSNSQAIVDVWSALLRDELEAERRIAEIARAEHEAASADDPEAFAEADDWSDV